MLSQSYTWQVVFPRKNCKNAIWFYMFPTSINRKYSCIIWIKANQFHIYIFFHWKMYNTYENWKLILIWILKKTLDHWIYNIKYLIYSKCIKYIKFFRLIYKFYYFLKTWLKFYYLNHTSYKLTYKIKL